MLTVTSPQQPLLNRFYINGQPVDVISFSPNSKVQSYTINNNFYRTLSYLNPPIIGFSPGINLSYYEKHIPSAITSLLYCLKPDSCNGYYLLPYNLTPSIQTSIINDLVSNHISITNPPYYVLEKGRPIYLRNKRFILKIEPQKTDVFDKYYSIKPNHLVSLDTESLEYFDFDVDNTFSMSYTSITEHEKSEIKAITKKAAKKPVRISIKETLFGDAAIVIGLDLPDTTNTDTTSCSSYNKILNLLPLTRESNFSQFKTIRNKQANIETRFKNLYNAKYTKLKAAMDSIGILSKTNSYIYSSLHASTFYNFVSNNRIPKDLNLNKKPSTSTVIPNNIIEKHILSSYKIFDSTDFISKATHTEIEFATNILTLSLLSLYLKCNSIITKPTRYDMYSVNSLYEIPFSFNVVSLAKDKYMSILATMDDKKILDPLIPILPPKKKLVVPPANTVAPSAPKPPDITLSDFTTYIDEITNGLK